MALKRPDHDYEKHYQLKAGDIFVKGGAYTGGYTVIASKKVGDKGRVIAIEPSPWCLERLRKNASDLANVTLVEKALWNKKGIEELWDCKQSSALRAVGDPTKGTGELIEVQVDTLDNILAELEVQTVNLLAWDIEGAGLEGIKGCNRFLSEKRIFNLALACYHSICFPDVFGDSEDFEEIKSILKSKGYDIIEDPTDERGLIYARIDQKETPI